MPKHRTALSEIDDLGVEEDSPESRQAPPSASQTASGASPASAWLDVKETGTVLGMRAVVLLATAFGRPPVRLLMRAVALYYALVHKTSRRASRNYRRRLGMANGFWDSYRHIFCFAQCAADRLFFVRGRHECFEIASQGHEYLLKLSEQKRGAILLGSHLGSFEAMGAAGAQLGLTVNMVSYVRNSEKINRLLESSKGAANARLLEARPWDIGFVVKLRECIERGELVGILGDRPVGGRTAKVEFLGSTAEFPTGVYALASVLRCPVYLTFALHQPPNRYNLYCEPFEELIALPRVGRKEALQRHAQSYAHRLEDYCQKAPNNWFNFYDFWSDD